MAKSVKQSAPGKSVKTPPGKTKQEPLTAKAFMERMMALRSDSDLRQIKRYFKMEEGEYGHGDKFIGVKMGRLFTLAKEYSAMPVKELEKLLESDIHEARAAAVSIMDKESRKKKSHRDQAKRII